MLIRVENKETGENFALSLEIDMTLSEVRKELGDAMSSEIMFLNQGSKIWKEQETKIRLEELLRGKDIIIIGKYGDIDQTLEVSDFSSLANDVILDYFEKKQLCRGLVFSKEKGITKSFHDIFTLSTVPKTLVEAQNTYSSSYYAFSKESCDMSLITSHKASLALNTSFIDANAEYSQAKSSKVHTEKVKEYLLSKFIVSLMSFQIDPSTCTPTKAFVEKVNSIMVSKAEKEKKIILLLEVLDEFGLYIPLEFTMGGALYATETTEITEYSKAEEEKKDFSAKADAKFSGFDISGSYDYGKESSSSESTSSKYKMIETKQIGGDAGCVDSKQIFEESLKHIAKWEIVDIKRFYPTILLLKQAYKFEGVDPMLFIKVKNLLMDYCMHSLMSENQPYINMPRYIDEVKKEALVLE